MMNNVCVGKEGKKKDYMAILGAPLFFARGRHP